MRMTYKKSITSSTLEEKWDDKKRAYISEVM